MSQRSHTATPAVWACRIGAARAGIGKSGMEIAGLHVVVMTTGTGEMVGIGARVERTGRG